MTIRLVKLCRENLEETNLDIDSILLPIINKGMKPGKSNAAVVIYT